MNIDELKGLGMWKDWQENVKRGLPNFAADALFVEQNSIKPERFCEVAEQVIKNGVIDVPGMTRDVQFGGRAVETRIGPVTRMWLDSNIEYDFLRRNIPNLRQQKVLDIGAGYGRLAVTLAPFVAEFTCVDAVPISTQVCREYTSKFNPAIRVLSLEEFVSSPPEITLAINIHSFNECPLAQITAWLHGVMEMGVNYLFLVDHAIDFETSYRSWDSGLPLFRPELDKRFNLLAQESLGLSFSTHSLWKRK